MIEVIPATIDSVNPYITLIMMKQLEDSINLKSYLQIKNNKIQNKDFIKKCLELQTNLRDSTKESLEIKYSVKFIHLDIRCKKIYSFLDPPLWSEEVIFAYKRRNLGLAKFSKRTLRDSLKSSSAKLAFPHIKNLYNFYDKIYDETSFKLENFYGHSEKLQVNFIFLDKNLKYFHNQAIKRYNDTIYIILDKNYSMNDEIRNFKILFNLSLLPKNFICEKSNLCSYRTNRSDLSKKHEKTCVSSQITFEKQLSYGSNQYIVNELINQGFLPREALRYRKTFFCSYDIETIETKNTNIIGVEAIHKILSISVASNSGRVKCFVRKNDTHESVIELIERFLDFVDNLCTDFRKSLPGYFFEAENKINEKIESSPKIRKRELSSLLSNLKKYCLMSIFGFNSGMIKFKS